MSSNNNVASASIHHVTADERNIGIRRSSHQPNQHFTRETPRSSHRRPLVPAVLTAVLASMLLSSTATASAQEESSGVSSAFSRSTPQVRPASDCPSTPDAIAAWALAEDSNLCVQQLAAARVEPRSGESPSRCPGTPDAIVGWLEAKGPNACKRQLRGS